MTSIERPGRFIRSIEAIQGFLIGGGFPVFTISLLACWEVFLIGMLLVPPSPSAFGSFAEDFRIWCFGYDPATGRTECHARASADDGRLHRSFLVGASSRDTPSAETRRGSYRPRGTGCRREYIGLRLLEQYAGDRRAAFSGRSHPHGLRFARTLARQSRGFSCRSRSRSSIKRVLLSISPPFEAGSYCSPQSTPHVVTPARWSSVRPRPR